MKNKNPFGKHSVETFPWKTKILLEKIPLKNFREKTNSHETTTLPGENNRGWQNFTLPGQNPRVKRKYKNNNKNKNSSLPIPFFKGEGALPHQARKKCYTIQISSTLFSLPQFLKHVKHDVYPPEMKKSLSNFRNI